jgi:hypothetical protein
MTRINNGSAGRWFKRVLWIGIGANMAMALPTLVAPERMIALVALPPASPVLWPRFAALLLLLLSVFYMPAAIDPDRYRATAWSAVGARLVGFVFFQLQEPAYHVLGFFDLAFFIPEVILLTAAARAAATAAATRPGGEAA